MLNFGIENKIYRYMEINKETSVENGDIQQDKNLRKPKAETTDEPTPAEGFKTRMENVSEIEKQMAELKEKQAKEWAEMERKLQEAKNEAEEFRQESAEKASKEAMDEWEKHNKMNLHDLADGPFLAIFFRAIKAGYDNKTEQFAVGDKAKADTLKMMDASTVLAAIKAANGVKEANSLKENESFIFLSRDGEKTNIKFMRSDEEVKQFTKSAEFLDIANRAVAEDGKPESERTVSYSFVTNNDTEGLQSKLSEKYGDLEEVDNKTRMDAQKDILRDEHSEVRCTIGNPDHFSISEEADLAKEQGEDITAGVTKEEGHVKEKDSADLGGEVGEAEDSEDNGLVKEKDGEKLSAGDSETGKTTEADNKDVGLVKENDGADEEAVGSVEEPVAEKGESATPEDTDEPALDKEEPNQTTEDERQKSSDIKYERKDAYHLEATEPKYVFGRRKPEKKPENRKSEENNAGYLLSSIASSLSDKLEEVAEKWKSAKERISEYKSNNQEQKPMEIAPFKETDEARKARLSTMEQRAFEGIEGDVKTRMRKGITSTCDSHINQILDAGFWKRLEDEHHKDYSRGRNGKERTYDHSRNSCADILKDALDIACKYPLPMNENEGMMIIVQDGKKLDFKIATNPSEFHGIVHSKEFRDLMDRAVKEQWGKPEDKTISIQPVSIKDVEKLQLELSEKYGDLRKASEFTDDKREQLCFDLGKSKHISQGCMYVGSSELHDKICEPYNYRFSRKEVIDQMQLLGYMPREVPKETLETLMKGEKTGLMNVTIKKNFDEIVTMEVRIRMERNKNGYCDYAIYPKRKELDLEKGVQEYKFTEADKENLRKEGTLGKPLELTDRNGRKLQCLVGVDNLTNEVVIINPLGLKFDDPGLPKLTEKEKDTIRQGQPVKRDDLVDKQGVKYTGWIICKPGEAKLSVSTRKPALVVEADFQPQVKANNEGARTEELKTDKSTTIDRKQTANNDPVEHKQEVKAEQKQTLARPKKRRMHL